jgi:phosphatidylserine/phosphatidylglycerophosphate/cardiolipin synthase-like enzyme
MKLFFIFFLINCFLFSSCSTEVKKEEIRAVDFCESIHNATSPQLAEKLKPLRQKMTKSTGVFSLENGDDAMVTRAWLCENATRTIDIQYFIFALDNVGLIAVDYIVRAADRGVKVRIIIDDILVDADEEKLLTLAAHKNIIIKIYNPSINIGKNIFNKVKNIVTNFKGVNQRMHNKTFIVDEDVVITGGRNIADEYFDYDHEYNFRDRDVLLIGGVTKAVVKSFNEFWNSTISKDVTTLLDTTKYKLKSTEKFEQLHQYACDPTNFWPQVRVKIKNIPEAFDAIQKSGSFQWVDSVAFVSDAPGKNNNLDDLKGGGYATTALINLVKQAKKSIVIQSPYLVTTELGKQLFKDAVQRGVSVKVMTNSLASTDNLQAFSGYQRDRNALLASRIKIYEYRPDAAIRFKVMTGALQKTINYAPVFGLHAKSMVIDGKIAVIGTFNVDPRSANLNTECVTIIYSKEIAQGILHEMEEEMKPENSWETTTRFNPDSKAGFKKNLKVKPMKLIPKDIL